MIAFILSLVYVGFYWNAKQHFFGDLEMLNFDRFVARHGEIVVQALIEQIERREGVCASQEAPLEVRWNFLMNDAPMQHQFAA